MPQGTTGRLVGMDYKSPAYGSSSLDNVDPRQLDKFMRDPAFVQQLSPDQLKAASYRLTTAKWTPQERIVYDAVQDGFTDMDSLPIATGLPGSEVRGALDALVIRGSVPSSILESGVS